MCSIMDGAGGKTCLGLKFDRVQLTKKKDLVSIFFPCLAIFQIEIYSNTMSNV